jgi:hypothetical protein
MVAGRALPEGSARKLRILRLDQEMMLPVGFRRATETPFNRVLELRP